MLYNELPVAFPWYDRIEKQNRYNEHVDKICDYKLIAPRDGLLPFQFTRTLGNVPQNWRIYEVNGPELIADITASLPLINSTAKNNQQYFTFYGGAIPGVNLQPGYYYSGIRFQDGTIQYSEMFHVPRQSFSAASPASAIPYMKLVWYNNSDLPPIYYNDYLPDLTPKFKNAMYIDSFIHASAPEITEEGENDGNDELIPTFQKATIKYIFQIVGPDFVKKAIYLLPLHDVVILTTAMGIRSGPLDKIKLDATLEANGALNDITVTFTEELVIKKGCSGNMN